MPATQLPLIPSKSPHVLRAATQLSADGLVGADGTIWSHACTVGQYIKGETFNLDRTAIENFVRVFTSGYPSKIPVDYDHASTSNDPEIRKLRAKGEVPKAGDVSELRGVFAPADFTGDLLATATTLAAKANRPLDDPRNLGLWMRWKPTAKAMDKIKAGEFSELSITFVDDWEDKSTGKGQGPTMLAVALLLLPFLDDMLPVAASRADRWTTEQDPAAGDSAAADTREDKMTPRTLTMFAAVAALVAKPVTEEEQAITELTALTPEVTRLRKLSSVVAERFEGETDPDKVGAKITELTAQVTASAKAAKEAKEAEIKTVVETTLKAHESKLVPLTRKIFERELARELTAGTKLEETETVKALSTMADTGITERATEADVSIEGSNAPGKGDAEAQLERKKDELLEKDPEIKALRAKDPVAAMDLAYDRAAAAIKYRSPQQRIALGR